VSSQVIGPRVSASKMELECSRSLDENLRENLDERGPCWKKGRQRMTGTEIGKDHGTPKLASLQEMWWKEQTANRGLSVCFGGDA
jgi:hypothetical protein